MSGPVRDPNDSPATPDPDAELEEQKLYRDRGAYRRDRKRNPFAECVNWEAARDEDTVEREISLRHEIDDDVEWMRR